MPYFPSEPESCLKESAHNDGGTVEEDLRAGGDTKERFLTVSPSQLLYHFFSTAFN